MTCRRVVYKWFLLFALGVMWMYKVSPLHQNSKKKKKRFLAPSDVRVRVRGQGLLDGGPLCRRSDGKIPARVWLARDDVKPVGGGGDDFSVVTCE